MQQLRILWYIVHSSLDDINVQKNGFVMVEVSQKWFTPQHFDRKLVRVVFRQESPRCCFDDQDDSNSSPSHKFLIRPRIIGSSAIAAISYPFESVAVTF
jgi:hypothetical protein